MPMEPKANRSKTQALVARRYLMILGMLLVTVGCLPQPNAASLYSDGDSNSVPIHLSLAQVPGATADQVNLLFATKSSNTSIGSCTAGTRADCKLGGPFYHPANLILDDATTKFYNLPNAITLSDGLIMIIVAANADLKITDTRAVSFAIKAANDSGTGTSNSTGTGNGSGSGTGNGSGSGNDSGTVGRNGNGT